MWVVGVEDPLTEGVEQDVSGEAGGEHHAGHTKSGYFGFSSGFPRRIFPNLEKARNRGEQEDEETDCQVEQAEGVA